MENEELILTGEHKAKIEVLEEAVKSLDENVKNFQSELEYLKDRILKLEIEEIEEIEDEEIEEKIEEAEIEQAPIVEPPLEEVQPIEKVIEETTIEIPKVSSKKSKTSWAGFW